MAAHMFSAVPHVNRPRSTFQRDHTLKTTMDSGYLVPIYLDEVIPGDTKKMDDHAFARLATPIFPVMDDAYLSIFYFFVPYRLVWEHAENFFWQREDPLDDNEVTDYVMPHMRITKEFNTGPGCTVGDIYDHFGLPMCNKSFKRGGTVDINVLPLRGYNRIFNDWFRDENLQSPAPHRRTDSGDQVEDFQLLKRGKRHDMFTSALPSPQLGDPIKLSFGANTLPVVGDGHTSNGSWGTHSRIKAGGIYGHIDSGGLDLSAQSDGISTDARPWLWSKSIIPGEGTGLVTKLDDLAITVNEWRQAVATQLLMERLMVGGHRYVEMLYSIFGVTSPDGRLQRTEYLGGSTTMVTTSPVTQTGGTTADSPQGNMAGFSVVSHNGHAFRRTFTEHGYIIGLAQVDTRMTYSQGLNKLWTRQTPYDHWFPYWDNLGEEVIRERELYCTGDSANDNKPFGYQERGYEYRYFPDICTGQMRPDIDRSLAAWHYGLLFDAPPNLNAAFIESSPPIKRTLAVQNEPEILLDIKFVQTDSREMSLYGIPGIGRHF